ncbi:MAG TPA: hypothetical protein VMT17_10335 [Anaeromyxobacteraceae bacterium]|nr:hypothetical protein [Anaeromyxobacteraceae bacterium]
MDRVALRDRPAVVPALRAAAAGWAVAALAAAAGRAALPPGLGALVPVFAAPLVFFAATLLYWNHPRHLRPVLTAALFLAVAAGLDLAVAASLRHGYAAFARPLETWLPYLLLFAASFGTARFLARPPERRVLLCWTASPAEQREPLPGDGLLAPPEDSTHAIAMRRPPPEVWPWIAQMGCGRAGWYSYDLLDNGGRESSWDLLKGLETLSVGDRLPATPDGRAWFEVLEVSPGAHLVLGSHLATRPMRSLPFSDPSPAVHVRSTWAFVLRPLGGGTRLVVRSRSVSRPHWLWAAWNAFFSLAHVVMQRRQLLGLRRRVEGPPGAVATSWRTSPP